MRYKKIRVGMLFLILSICLMAAGCSTKSLFQENSTGQTEAGNSATLEQLPPFSGNAYVTLNDNQPEFEEDNAAESFESYQELDSLGRCGTAYASIGRDLMPTEERGNISPVKPSGWQTAKYDCVEGKYLYNRCHLIGFQLSGENANRKNLITGTRYLNVEGMLPFENKVAEYVKETGNHVLYRVTPVYEGDNLVANGVQMEARSVEDDGAGVCFNIYAYNVQPGITIDYATGESSLAEQSGGANTGSSTGKDTEKQEKADSGKTDNPSGQQYILNTNTHRFHVPSCSSVAETKEKNKENFTGSREELINQGYEPCGRCKP